MVMEEGGSEQRARARPTPGARATSWLVTTQPRSTKRAVCRGCHQFFEEGEVRVCTQSDRKHGRFLHVDCIPGGLRANLEFQADSQGEASEARSLMDKVRHLTTIQAPEAGSSLDSEIAPSSLDSCLPSLSWFQSLKWDDLMAVNGDTFVQVPMRLEEAFCDAVGVALREATTAANNQTAAGAWKAFLLLPWLLLFRPTVLEDNQSCATLLEERLDRFWQGDAEAMFREHIFSCRRRHSSISKSVVSNRLLARKVKTLCRANEVGRALKAADGVEKITITEDVALQLCSLFTARAEDQEMDV